MLRVSNNFTQNTAPQPASNTASETRAKTLVVLVCRATSPKHPKLMSNGVIHPARNHAWINPCNPAIASCIRSNHDISWITTVSKSLSLVYYITNYATKDDVSSLQMVTKAALLKEAIDHANTTQSPSTADILALSKRLT
jgi:transcriptional regulator of met regulon